MSRRDKVNKLKLSSWNLPEEVVEYYHKQGVKEMFPWQVQCLQTGKALQGGNLLYSAPTSAGKTLVAEILSLKRMLATKRKAIFILPFVSVAREKMFTLRAMYSGLGLTVGGFMGSQTPPGGFKRVDVAVCTIERANSLINRLLEKGKLHKLAVIVVDELHMVGDSSRGCLIEPLLTKVNYFVETEATEPSNENLVQIIGMSATLPNMHVLSKWLKADLYCTDFRPVPLTEYVKVGTSILDCDMQYVRDISVPGVYNNDSELIVNLCLETIREGKSVLIFCPGKAWCEKLSTLLAKSFYMIMAGKEETSPILSDAITKVIDKEKILEVLDQLGRTPAGLSDQLKLCISYASAFHHAGLTLEEKDILESAFRQNVIRVLVSTTTLSSGVNLPAQRVIIRSPMFLGQLIDTLTYKQMVGRAGRKGIDSFGESVLVCKPSEKKSVNLLLNSELPPATSQLILRDDDGNYILRSSVKRALLEMIASGTAKTTEALNKYINCTLLAAEVESHSGNVADLVENCLRSLREDEFVNIEEVEGGVTLVTPTQLGSAVFASSMNPDDSLLVLSDLNKARKQFVLENELHMVYQVTPLNSLNGAIDWMRYLSLWESLSGDQQRVGELVGVSERFITLSHHGRRRRNNDSQQKSLRIHRRFYTALILHELVNEVSLTDVERKFGVNRGNLQSLQQNAAIFAGMVCTFCDRLGWKPLKLLLVDFQQRLDVGVRSELVDLTRISCLDAKKARHFYDSGLHSISELVNLNIQHVSFLLQTFLPFESSKQGFGETEWELKDRQARRVFIVNRKSLTILEAAQLIMEEAQKVFQHDCERLGVGSSLKHHLSTISLGPSNKPSLQRIGSPTEAETEVSYTTSNVNAASNSLSSDSIKLLADDSKESADSKSKYKELLDHITECTNTPSVGQIYNKNDMANIAHPLNTPEVSCSQGSLVWGDSFVCPSQTSEDETQQISQNAKPSMLLTTSKACSVKRSHLSPDLTYTKLRKIRRIRTSTVKPASVTSQYTSSHDTPSVSLHSLPGGVSIRSVTPISKKEAVTPVKSSHANTIFLAKQEHTTLAINTAGIIKPSVKQEPVTPANNAYVISTPLSKHVPVIDATPITKDSIDPSCIWSPNDSSLLMASDGDQPAGVNINAGVDINAGADINAGVDVIAGVDINAGVDVRDATGESNDLFNTESMESLVWSPIPEESQSMSCPTTPPLPQNKPPVDISPKISSADRIIIVDVITHPSLYHSFMSEWAEATVYSLSLACDTSTQKPLSRTADPSIGPHSTTSSSQSVLADCDSQLSTSTVHSPQGVILNQYGVLVSGLSVCLNSNTVFYVDLTDIADDVMSDSTNQGDGIISVRSILEDVSKVLENTCSSKVIFDSKEQLKRLFSLLGRSIQLGAVFDPKVAMWLLDPAEKEHSLLGVVNKTVPYLSNAVTSNIGVCIGVGSVGINPHPGTSARLRSCYESLAIMAMRLPLLSCLRESRLLDALTSLEMPHLACLSQMEVYGFGFDVTEFNRQTKLILDALNLIEKKCNSFTKRVFDLGSPKDIGEVLFVELHLPYERKKSIRRKGAPWSTCQAQLEKIKSLHPLPGLILLWRKLHSALKCLVQPLDKSKVWSEERSMYRIYSTCSIQTATGRITMHEPNLQTIRKDIALKVDGVSELSDSIVSLRNVFTASQGYTLLSADYSQLELRIISHLASDSVLIPLLNAGGDVFKDIASRWKNIPVTEVTNEQRQQAKQICYGIIYGMGSKSLSEQLLVEEEAADQLLADFQSTFIGLKKYIISVVESCKELGYVTTLAGRRRYLPAINSTSNHRGRSQAERQAVNTTVQGSAADLVKHAVVNLQKVLPPDVSLVLQIHDELIYEVPKPLLHQTARLLKHTMESSGKDLNLNVDMTVRIKSGPTWAQLEDLKC